MKKESFLSNLRFFKPRSDPQNCKKQILSDGLVEVRCGRRDWEEIYHRRWEHDKVVRSTHGVNCTGSCSWKVFVKDGIIVWETQQVDYPGSGAARPDYEPRGCPRGATFSWYVYSPVRVKYPYVRSVLLTMWREALRAHNDPVSAWESIVDDPARVRRYRKARGKGGLVRTSWEEAATLIAASLVHTIRKYGPDRIFGFTPIPAMSMVCFASGARFISLIGGSMISFYDWYADLPPASPQIWGDQTDVPESADWYNATYMIVWGTNLPQTRTPDAHFYSEARYRGTTVTAVAPDYAEYVKFADTWLPAKAGTDGALAMAMTFVILKENYIDRQVAYFQQYAKKYTDLPFVVMLRKEGEKFISDRFLRATDMGLDISNGEWKTMVYDAGSKALVVPNGSIGFRWEEGGHWNLELVDAGNGTPLDPVLTFSAKNDEWVPVAFPLFQLNGARVKIGTVPIMRLQGAKDTLIVTTVFDLLCAHMGVDRGRGGDCPTGYDDPAPYTPAWQELITGVPRQDAIRVAREFAANAAKTGGKSMIFLGAGTNHWYHSDATYRTILNLTTLCGCQGVNGGGWAHYVGQEKIRPIAGWSTVAFAQDWCRPPRHQNGTSFFYFATDHWRYENVSSSVILSPLYSKDAPQHIADYNIIAARLGWLPSYPQFDRSPIRLCEDAEADGASSDEEIVKHVVERIRTGDVRFALEDPCNPANYPRVMFFWRANVLGASAKGHEYFLKHLLGTDEAVLNTENTHMRPSEMTHRDADPDGKLDLLVTLEMRMSTSALYSDVVLPAASWYEMHDLSTTDLHPFIHPFNPAVDPLWETKTNWDQFMTIAQKFSRLAEDHLGTRKDLVTTALFHDQPSEIAQPFGQVKDWKKGEVEPIPGKTMPAFKVVTRQFADACKMMTSLGPLVCGAQGVGAKGVSWDATDQHEELKRRLGAVDADGVSRGMPALTSGRHVAEAILALSPETNGEVALKAWQAQERNTGRQLAHLSIDRLSDKFTFADLNARPRKVITSPTWSGMESETRTYAPFSINVEEKIPFHTLTGRAHFYLDHEWMRMFGDELPTFRPPLDLQALGSTRVRREEGRELILNYLTPHSKWSIHSTYSETLIMLTLFRGGETVWINNEDAASIGLQDHDWIECFNVNGVVIARAVVSHRIPRGKAFMYHAQERLINMPVAPISGKRGGTHNSVTRIFMKPTHMIGGYAQFSYFPNYYGPTGAQRDEVIILRKLEKLEWGEA